MVRAQSCLESEFDRKFTKDDVDGRTYPWYIEEGTNNIICNKKKWPEWASAEHNQFQYNNCLIEKEFVEAFVNLLNSGYERNPDFIKMSNPEYAATCVPDNTPKRTHSADSCCGTGMSKRPYNSALVQCCNHEIKDIGTC